MKNKIEKIIPYRKVNSSLVIFLTKKEKKRQKKEVKNISKRMRLMEIRKKL